jgi:nucleoside-diphosphate-sugar epimerase
MKIFLTGATGFVGRHLLRELTSRGHQVRIVVRSLNHLDERINKEQIEVMETEDLFEESLDRLEVLCMGCDIVIHAAWFAEPGQYLTAPVNLNCLEGTVRLAKAFAFNKGRRFIGLGSCAEYQPSMKPLNVNSPLHPTTLYAACKISTFYTLTHFFEGQAIDFAWCRLFYLYGEGEDARRLVPYLHQQLNNGHPALLSSGNQIRDFIDVTRAAQMIVDIVLGDSTGPKNICTGKATSVREMAESIAQQYGRVHLLEFGARQDNLFDPPMIVGDK